MTMFGNAQGLSPGNLGMKLFKPSAIAAAANWWNPDGSIACAWAAYQPKSAASFAASLTDLTGNGNNAGDPGGAATPSWDAVNGWKFDGAGNYLTTTFTLATDQSQSVLVQYTNVTNVGYLTGMRGNGDWMLLRPDIGAANVLYRHGSANVLSAPRLLAGNLGIAGNQGYRNGASDGGLLAGWGGAGTTSLYIGAYNRAGAALTPIAAYAQAVAIYDCTLTAPQVALVAAAMAAL